MKILVLNGSPKGAYSITLQTVMYLQKKFKECEFEILHVGQTIKKLEKDFTPAIEAINNADALLFSYPVYTFIAPSQLHRFIELMKEKQVDVKGKYASQLSTSKHFYDVTAHRYIMENCQDMGMRFVRGLSADMDDLTKEKGQQEAVQFMQYFLWSMTKGICEPPLEQREKKSLIEATVPATQSEKTLQKEVVIIADCGTEDSALQGMIERFQAVLPCKSRVVNIREYPFRGGCLGCFNCAVSGKCIYTDGFDEFLRNNIQSGDAMVYAFTIKDHSMGGQSKVYGDR